MIIGFNYLEIIGFNEFFVGFLISKFRDIKLFGKKWAETMKLETGESQMKVVVLAITNQNF